MKVLNMDEVVEVFNENIVEPRDFEVKGINHIEDNVIVYLNIKDCYDEQLSDGMVNFANDFLYSRNEWKSLIDTMKKGYLIQSNFNNFIKSVNEGFYNCYVVSGEFEKVRKDLSNQLNNVIDDCGCVFSLSDNIDVKLAIEDRPFYKDGFVLEKLYEYSMYRVNR